MEQDDKSLQNNDNGAGEGTPKTFNVKVWMDANGEPIMQTVTEDELVNGYLRQSDYTKKTQELAEEKKVLSSKASKAQDWGYKWDPADDEAVEAYLQSKGYAKADYVDQLVEKKLNSMSKSQQDEKTLGDLIASNPDLKQFEWAIRKIAATDDSALEDIVVKYGFSSHDKLAKAKANRTLLGNPSKIEEKKEKPYSEWTKEEKDAFKAKYGNQQFR